MNENVVAVKRVGREIPVAGLSEVAVTVAGQRRYGLILVPAEFNYSKTVVGMWIYKTGSLLCGKRFVPTQYHPRLP